MPLSHLHLHVRDRALAPAILCVMVRHEHEGHGGEITFMTDEPTFLLALMHDPSPAPLPPWFHFGFHLESAAAVIALNG